MTDPKLGADPKMDPFQITDAELLVQVAEGTATSMDGDHLIWLEPEMWVLTKEGATLPRQAVRYLDVGQWDTVLWVTCDQHDCVRPDHIVDAAGYKKHQEEQDLVLVQQDSQLTLAALYKKAKSKGLVTSTSAYH